MNPPVNILLVDDEVRNLNALESILESPDYHFVRAQNADEALRALISDSFAVIVLDVRLPDMNGVELAQMLKRRKKTQHLPIIFLTAYYQEDEHVMQGYGAGAVDYLSKPYNPVILRSKVAVFVDLFRKSRALEAEIAERQQIEVRLRQEIEDRRQAQMALEASESRLRRLVESNIVGVAISELDGTIVEANDNFLELIGYMRRDVQDRRLNWSLLTPTRFAEADARARMNLKQRGTSAPYEKGLLRKNGQCVPVLIGLAAFQTLGVEGQTVAFVVDLTDRRQLERQIVETSDSEQQRLGHELHDGLCQIMVGLRMRATVLSGRLQRPAAAVAELRSIQGLLDTALEAAVGLSHAMSPAVDELPQLDVALSQLGRYLERLYRLPFTVELLKEIHIPDPAVAMHLYRITQEAAINAAKHSGTDQIIITLSGDERECQIRVRDNGKGITPESTMRNSDSGMGLRIMQFRANLIGARLETHVLAAGGTEVVCSFTLNPWVDKSPQAPTSSEARVFMVNGKSKENGMAQRKLDNVSEELEAEVNV